MNDPRGPIFRLALILLRLRPKITRALAPVRLTSSSTPITATRRPICARNGG